MAACDNLLLVQAEFDGELDAAAAAESARHRETCAQCRAAYADMERVRAGFGAAALSWPLPPDLRRRLRARIAAPAPLARRLLARWREGASFVLGAAVAAGIALVMLQPAAPDVLGAVVADHIRALQPGHLEDVVSSDQHTVKPWFDGRLDFAPPVKDLADRGFPLLGGRLDYLEGRAVAALVYGHDKHRIDLFVWPKPGRLAPVAGSRDGYNTVHWVEGGMNFWAVSDLEADELARFVHLWQTKA